MLEPPASTWMLVTSPYSLWKEALVQGITCLLTGPLTAPSPGCSASSRNTLVLLPPQMTL